MLEIPFVKAPSGASRAESSSVSAARGNDTEAPQDDFDTVMAEENDTADSSTAETQTNETDDGKEASAKSDGTEEKLGLGSEAKAAVDEDVEAADAAVFDTDVDDPVDAPVETEKKPAKAGQPVSELAFLQQTNPRIVTADDGGERRATIPVEATEQIAKNTDVKTDVTQPATEPKIRQGLVGTETPASARGDMQQTRVDVRQRETPDPVNKSAPVRATETEPAITNKPDIPAAQPGLDRKQIRRIAEFESSVRNETPAIAANRLRSPATAIPTGTMPVMQNKDLSVSAIPKGEVFDLQPVAGTASEITTQSDPRSAAASSLSQTLARAETPAMIARQMAEVLQKMPDKPVELMLSPRELGKVRMSIAASENAITVTVLAERPETLDLMKRNIDQLAREFQSLGYESIDFAFSEGQQQTGSDSEQQSTQQDTLFVNHDAAGVDDENVIPPDQITMVTDTGVDIRL
ncbi:flagellar hook-length control protein FliK [Roseobacter sp. S98]|uniref:flagellar hook-length control protein FliK n=1 Tax=Roseobacter algicola (ex Choi et al. 2025) (nom. illeg.) TaxID=3092138 RepID=UPI0035C67975